MLASTHASSVIASLSVGDPFVSPSDTVSYFDFTVCQAGVSYDGDWRGVVAPEFYRDLAAKRLVLARGDTPVSTFNRVLRYVGRGYRLDHMSKVELLLKINALDPETIKEALDDEY